MTLSMADLSPNLLQQIQALEGPSDACEIVFNEFINYQK